jgi:ubiquinone/menaquinone biosynthesis C-methylase UbiE
MLNEYRKQVIDFYTRRTDYDNDFTRDRALHLLDVSLSQPGERVLDVATGTGFIALEVARQVGDSGSVVGIDITASFLESAREKANLANIHNVEFIEVSESDYQPITSDRFDRIYCSHAIVIFTDIPDTFRRWHNWLKPTGTIAFTSHSTTSFFTTQIVEACRSQGIELPRIHDILGTRESCENILSETGFIIDRFDPVDLGKWLTVEEAKSYWNATLWLHPSNPLVDLPAETTAAIKADYDRQIESIAVDGKIWFENITFYVSAKPIRAGFTGFG